MSVPCVDLMILMAHRSTVELIRQNGQKEKKLRKVDSYNIPLRQMYFFLQQGGFIYHIEMTKKAEDIAYYIILSL